MKLKYSPIKANRDTRIEVLSGHALNIDGEPYEFAEDAVAWPDVAEQTRGAIIEAHRENGELCLTVLRRYVGARPTWDDGEYHEVEEGEAP